MSDQKYFTKTVLKSRGWTDTLLKRFFPTPTKERQNYRYRSGPEIKLYDIDQVKSIESSAEFQAAKAITAKRSQSGKACADKRHTATLDWVEQLPSPAIPEYSQDKLYEIACNHYNDLWDGRGKDKHASKSDSVEFLNRISVNFLRHELSPYEDQLIQARGRIGADNARIAIREKILDSISEIYLWLLEECMRQMDEANFRQDLSDMLK